MTTNNNLSRLVNDNSHAHGKESTIENTKSLFMDDGYEDEYIEHFDEEEFNAQSSNEEKSSEETESPDGTLLEQSATNGLVPTVITDTTVASDEPYVPMLPKAAYSNKKRQLILDTETTGLEAHNGDRIIEIGVVEVVNRRFTGEKLHVYLDPQRDMDPEAVAVHGITAEFLAGKPKFADVAQSVLDFLKGGEIVAHNAPFDMGFLVAEFNRIGIRDFDKQVTVLDTLAVAKAKYPGQKNSLDALVKRLEILTKDRTFHGALLDAEILADVYLTMTGGQVKLGLGETSATQGKHIQFDNVFKAFKVSQADDTLHEQWLLSMADAQANDAFLSNWGLVASTSVNEDNAVE